MLYHTSLNIRYLNKLDNINSNRKLKPLFNQNIYHTFSKPKNVKFELFNAPSYYSTI